MDIGIMAARRQTADEQIATAAATLAERFGVPLEMAGLRRHNPDPAVKGLFFQEAVADFLMKLATATDPPVELPSVQERAADLTVAELATRIAEADGDALDRLEDAERAGKARKGVLRQIDERRAALALEADAADMPDPESAVADQDAGEPFTFDPATPKSEG